MTRLLLLGGGHAHLFVLEALTRGAFEGAEVTLVSPVRRQAYSGMVPGLIAGRYRADELSFDLEAIARTVGARYVPLAGRRILPQAGRIELADGRLESYDILSVATGSALRGGALPGVAEQALPVKPIDRAGQIVPALSRALAADEAPAVVVVGGGAAGIEIALAVRARLRLLAGGDVGTVTLLEAAPGLFGGQLPRAARAAAQALARNRVVLRLGAEVASASASGVRLADGTELPARVLVWAAGATATDVLRTSGLALDPQGFLLVDDRLRSPSDGRIFAAGDAATPAGWPQTAKAGVYAVRAGPVLCANLAAACRGADPPLRYRPQRRFLALLNTGDGRAICSYGSFAASGRWAMTLKDRIDRRFMRRFKRLESSER
jgi:selenide,water dikinase